MLKVRVIQSETVDSFEESVNWVLIELAAANAKLRQIDYTETETRRTCYILFELPENLDVST